MKKRIKITHLISSGGIGGGEKHLLIFAKGLSKKKYELGFVVPEKGFLEGKLRELGFSPAIIDINRSLFSVPVIFGLWKYLKTSKPDIVHTHGARANFYGRTASSLAGTPLCISTIHNSIMDYPVSGARKRFYTAVEKLTSGKAAKIITVSDYLRDELINKYGIPAEKLITIYPALDSKSTEVTEDVSDVRKKLGVTGTEILICQLGRMTPQKGFSYFIDAAVLLSKKYDNLKWLFAGDGPLRSELENSCRDKGISGRCIFSGFREDVGNIISASDIFVSSSLSEGFPVTVIEAAYMGKPIVATRVSGVPEFINNGVNGILVEPGSSRKLADCIEELVTHEALRSRLGDEARKSVSGKFSAEYMLNQFSSLYDELTASSEK